MPADYLYDLADTLLTQADLAVDETRTGVPGPHQVYVAHAEPVADIEGCCEGPDKATGDQAYAGGILTVMLGGPDSDPLDFAPATGKQCLMDTQANFTVTLLRCLPSLNDQGRAPTPDEMDAAHRQLLIDWWALVTGLRDARRAKVWPEGVDCGSFRFTTTTPIPQQGGCGGWQLTVQVRADDTGPGGAS